MRLLSIILLFSLSQMFSGYQGLSAQSNDYSLLVKENIDASAIDQATLNEAILKATNRIRAKKGLNPLVLDKFLMAASEIHAQYLAEQKQLVHLNYSNKKLKTPAMRVASTGVEMVAVGENLARMSIYRLGKDGQFFVDEEGNSIDSDGNPLTTHTYEELATLVTEGWFNSKGHRENLLGDYTHLGLAESEMKTGKEILTELVFVQNFGKY